MSGTRTEVSNFIKTVGAFIRENSENTKTVSPEVIICPPFTALDAAERQTSESGFTDFISLGAQNASRYLKGAHTGEISVSMLADLNVKYVLLGHSERRRSQGEDNELIHQKAVCVQKAGMIPAVCIGETLEEKESGKTKEVLREQLKKSIPADFKGLICYEPVWAIGTGKVPSKKDLQNIASFLKLLFEEELSSDIKPELLYGGSVNSENFSEILDISGISGVLMGKAGQNAKEFKKIWQLAKDSSRAI